MGVPPLQRAIIAGKVDNTLSAEKENHQGGIEIALDHMEAIVLAVSEPPHNRQGGRFGTNVVQYLQFRDEDVLGLNDREMLAALYKSQFPDKECR